MKQRLQPQLQLQSYVLQRKQPYQILQQLKRQHKNKNKSDKNQSDHSCKHKRLSNLSSPKSKTRSPSHPSPCEKSKQLSQISSKNIVLLKKNHKGSAVSPSNTTNFHKHNISTNNPKNNPKPHIRYLNSISHQVSIESSNNNNNNQIYNQQQSQPQTQPQLHDKKLQHTFYKPQHTFHKQLQLQQHSRVHQHSLQPSLPSPSQQISSNDDKNSCFNHSNNNQEYQAQDFQQDINHDDSKLTLPWIQSRHDGSSKNKRKQCQQQQRQRQKLELQLQHVLSLSQHQKQPSKNCQNKQKEQKDCKYRKQRIPQKQHNLHNQSRRSKKHRRQYSFLQKELQKQQYQQSANKQQKIKYASIQTPVAASNDGNGNYKNQNPKNKSIYNRMNITTNNKTSGQKFNKFKQHLPQSVFNNRQQKHKGQHHHSQHSPSEADTFFHFNSQNHKGDHHINHNPNNSRFSYLAQSHEHKLSPNWKQKIRQKQQGILLNYLNGKICKQRVVGGGSSAQKSALNGDIAANGSQMKKNKSKKKVNKNRKNSKKVNKNPKQSIERLSIEKPQSEYYLLEEAIQDDDDITQQQQQQQISQCEDCENASNPKQYPHIKKPYNKQYIVVAFNPSTTTTTKQSKPRQLKLFQQKQKKQLEQLSVRQQQKVQQQKYIKSNGCKPRKQRINLTDLNRGHHNYRLSNDSSYYKNIEGEERKSKLSANRYESNDQQEYYKQNNQYNDEHEDHGEECNCQHHEHERGRQYQPQPQHKLIKLPSSMKLDKFLQEQKQYKNYTKLYESASNQRFLKEKRRDRRISYHSKEKDNSNNRPIFNRYQRFYTQTQTKNSKNLVYQQKQQAQPHNMPKIHNHQQKNQILQTAVRNKLSSSKMASSQATGGNIFLIRNASNNLPSSKSFSISSQQPHRLSSKKSKQLSRSLLFAQKQQQIQAQNSTKLHQKYQKQLIKEPQPQQYRQKLANKSTQRWMSSNLTYNGEGKAQQMCSILSAVQSVSKQDQEQGQGQKQSLQQEQQHQQKLSQHFAPSRKKSSTTTKSSKKRVVISEAKLIKLKDQISLTNNDNRAVKRIRGGDTTQKEQSNDQNDQNCLKSKRGSIYGDKQDDVKDVNNQNKYDKRVVTKTNVDLQEKQLSKSLNQIKPSMLQFLKLITFYAKNALVTSSLSSIKKNSTNLRQSKIQGNTQETSLSSCIKNSYTKQSFHKSIPKTIPTLPTESQQVSQFVQNYQPHSALINMEDLLKSKNFKIKFQQQQQNSNPNHCLQLYFGQYSTKNNMKQGKGVLIKSTKCVFQGTFHQNNKIFGQQTFQIGYYKGSFRQNKRHGKGQFCWLNGQYYNGEWVNGKKQGTGVWTSKNGDNYVGEWIGGRVQGKGVHTTEVGQRYQGDFINFLKEGWGKELLPNGDCYQGQFKNGKPDGSGFYQWKQEQSGLMISYEGSFVQGLRSGYGVLKSKRITAPSSSLSSQQTGHKNQSCSYYKGQFLSDKPQGECQITIQGGQDSNKNLNQCQKFVGYIKNDIFYQKSFELLHKQQKQQI